MERDSGSKERLSFSEDRQSRVLCQEDSFRVQAYGCRESDPCNDSSIMMLTFAQIGPELG